MAEYNRHNPFYKREGFWKWVGITLLLLALAGSVFNLTPAGRQSAEQQSIEETIREAAQQEKERGHIVYAAEIDRPVSSRIEAIDVLYAQTVEESLGVIQAIEPVDDYEAVHVVMAEKFELSPSLVKKEFFEMYGQRIEKITREMLYDGHDGGTFRNVQFLNPEGEQLAKTGVFQGEWRVK